MIDQLCLIIIAILGFVILFSIFDNGDNKSDQNLEHMLGGEYKYDDYKNDIRVNINTDNYDDPYYNDYGCRSTKCMRRRFWYGDTPYIWGNWTRYPKVPYYIGLHNWYRDTYAIPYYWFYG